MNHSRFIQTAAAALALVVVPALGQAQTRTSATHAGDKAEWLRAHPHAPRSMARTAANDDWKQAWSAAHPNQEYPAAGASNSHATRTHNGSDTHTHALSPTEQNTRRGGGPSSTYDFGTGYDYDTLNHGASNDLNRSSTSPNRTMNQGNNDSMLNSDTGASGSLITGGSVR